MPVKLPNLDVKRELARKLAESAISQIPILGGPYVAMLNIAYRPDAEKKIVAWRGDVTKSINEIERLVAELVPTIKLSNNASTLGHWLSMSSTSGRTDSKEFDTICDAFPSATKLELEDACGELELEKLANTSGALGRKIMLVRPTNLLFEIFDPLTQNDSNPRVDAAHLACTILQHLDGLSAVTMLEKHSWAIRRLNPALSILCDMISDGGQSAEVHRDFVCASVFPHPEDRARLRKYANSVLGE